MKLYQKIIGGLAVVGVVGFFYYWNDNSSSPDDQTSTNNNTTTTGNSVSTTTATANTASQSSTTAVIPVKVAGQIYRDNTYMFTSKYFSPGGQDSLQVTLTFKSDKIADAVVVNKSTDRTSSGYQNAFIGGFKSQVVGQAINSVNLSAVSGASLTTAAFMDALNNIKTEAAAEQKALQ